MIRTETNSVVARGLSEDAIKLPHLAYGGLGPTVRGDYRFDLFTKSRDALGHGSEIIQDMCDGLARRYATTSARRN